MDVSGLPMTTASAGSVSSYSLLMCTSIVRLCSVCTALLTACSLIGNES